MKKMLRMILPQLIFLLLPYQIVLAEDGQAVSNGQSLFTILRLIFSLMVILALIFIFFRMAAKNNGRFKNGLYQHLGGIPLGQNKTVQLVEIGNKIYILGVGEDIQLIEVIQNGEDIHAIKESITWQQQQKVDLIDWLKEKVLKRFPLKEKREVNEHQRFNHLLTEKMEQLKERRMSSLNQWLDETDERIEKRDYHE